MDSKRTNRVDENDGNKRASKRAKDYQKQESEIVPGDVVAWVRKRIERNEEISMVSFSNAFELTHEEDAHAVFMSLLSLNFLPATLKNAISKKYEIWRKNDGVVFWTWRSAARKVDVSTVRTVEDLVDRAQQFTSMILQPTSNGLGSDATSRQTPSEHTTSTTSAPESEDEADLDSNPGVDSESKEENAEPESEEMNGANTVPIPPIPADMPAGHLRLFKHARNCLQQYQKKGGKGKALIKDAMVSMSCVLNLYASEIEKYFEDEDLNLARQSCFREGFNQDHVVIETLQPLREVLKEGIDELSCYIRVRRGEIAQRSLAGTSGPQDRIHDQILSVVQHLCSFIMDPPFGSSPPSEQDCSHQWAAIFSLLKSRNISMHTSGENELANLEIKAPSACESVLIQQNRKNIRINRCIQLALHRIGLDAAIIAGDIVGYLGVFYVIQRYGDIFVCGPVTADTVFIPTNSTELEEFLDGESLSVIINFVRSVDKLSTDVADLRQKHKLRQARNAMVQRIGPRCVTPPPKPKTFQDTVLFTPTTKR
ncbi:hypothetical protein BGW38_003641 [Lunasporangiospora selenospora]|uniref:Uncharacterized protein n=1 Tax=Lunasporangiospora selenospora TaxID=979761 RepID=A0A9P6KCQ0_9FUNG|nr:hypothetical protein BGW38_003641 [Lunasporangiospora selenospora]